MIHRAKKSLGQNFLKSQLALNKMCEAGEVNNEDIILEIGPGKGALTDKLVKKAGRVIAVEKDDALSQFLMEKFKEEIKNEKLEIINDDILKIDVEKIIPAGKNYKLIANIPYNITGAILKKFLESEKSPKKMVLLVQKEVAERIVAREGGESILSLSVKVYGEPKYIMKVSKKFFSPSPKVDSAIILIDNISNKKFRNKNDEKIFFDLIKTGFAHKRKKLLKNLEKLGPNSENDIHKIFQELEIDENSRAEDLKLEKWLSISKYL